MYWYRRPLAGYGTTGQAVDVEDSAQEKRRHPRQEVDAIIRASVEELDGTDRSFDGACVNISEGGLLMQTPTPIPMGTPIQFHIQKMRFGGRGLVRHCGDSGNSYFIGLEFTGGARWTPAPASGAVDSRVLPAVKSPSAEPVVLLVTFVLVVMILVFITAQA